MTQEVDPKIKAGITKDLNAFERIAHKVATKVSHGSFNEPMLTEALQTQAVQSPVDNSFVAKQIGNFAVFPRTNNQGKARYEVANMTTGQKLIGDLHLAEGANAIAKLMNKGHSFYSPQIKSILEFEQKYIKHYRDAVSFKKRVKDSTIRDQISETRFEEAKLNAQQIKEQLNNFTKFL